MKPQRYQLTPRQIEVAKLLHAGLGTSEVAARLNISINTVSRHMLDAACRIGEPGRPLVVLVRHYERYHALPFHVELTSTA